MAHALGEELEKFLRFEIGCEERANSTIFSAHQSEELWKWQENKERTIRRECIKGGVEEERDGARKRTRPSAAHCGGIHRERRLTLLGNNDARGTAAVRTVQ